MEDNAQEERTITDLNQLNPKQKAFVRAYAVCRNGSEAARQAGYSTHSAGVIANRLLNKAHIRALIERQEEYSFETWCRAVKGIIHDENAWQAKLKGLELYGKAKGWLRESLITNNILGINQDDLVKIRQSIADQLRVSDNKRIGSGNDVTISPQVLDSKEDTASAQA